MFAEHTSDTSTNYDSFLNWTFSSPNMVRTVQTLLHSQLACNEMQASARTCSRQHDPKCRLKSSQYTLIIPHRVIQLTTISFWVSETRLCLPQVNKFPPKQAKNLATPSSIFICFFSFIHRRALLSANQRQWSSNRANVPRTCWAKLFGPRRYLWRILPTRFAKKSWPN